MHGGSPSPRLVVQRILRSSFRTLSLQESKRRSIAPQAHLANVMNETLRALFPVTERAIYLNHAAVSPPPTPTIKAIQSQLRRRFGKRIAKFPQLDGSQRECARQLLADMLGARPEQVAFMRNTSDGLSTVANGLDWRPGDNMVTFRNEFPSNIYPWLRVRDAYGVEVRMCEERDGRVDLEELIGLIDTRRGWLQSAMSSMPPAFAADLERIGRAARAHDALLVVDVIQALGVVPIDVESQLVDVAAGACHKWLLTPEGVGFALSCPTARGANSSRPWSVGSAFRIRRTTVISNRAGTGERLPGKQERVRSALIHGLEASLKLLAEIGSPRIQKLSGSTHRSSLRTVCKDSRYRSSQFAARRRESRRSSAFDIVAGLSPMDLYAHLKKRDIITAPRGDRLRISPHLYNTLEEIDAIGEARFRKRILSVYERM